MKLTDYLQNWRAWNGSKVKQQDSLEKKEGAEAKNKSLQRIRQETKVVQKNNNRKPIVMLAVHYTQQCKFMKICSFIFSSFPLLLSYSSIHDDVYYCSLCHRIRQD
jgi:hypothetical protein